MSERWFRVYVGLVDDPKVQRLPLKVFRAQFLAALAGEINEFADLVRPVRPRSGEQWMLIRADIFRRDDYTCTYCGERGGKLECDHIIPVARGGLDDPDNLTTACFACNRSKRDKLVEEWLR